MSERDFSAVHIQEHVTHCKWIYFRGKQFFCFHFCLPSQWDSALSGNNVLNQEQLKIDPILKWFYPPWKQTGSHKSDSPL